MDLTGHITNVRILFLRARSMMIALDSIKMIDGTAKHESTIRQSFSELTQPYMIVQPVKLPQPDISS